MSKPMMVAILVLVSAPALAAEKKKRAKPKPPLFTMTVITRTGNTNRYAEASGLSVYVLINGSKHKIRLNQADKTNFLRGATDKFEKLPVNVPLEEIESLRLIVGGRDMWKCDAVYFQFFKGDKESQLLRFTPKQYFSGEKEGTAFRAVKFMDFKVSPKWEDANDKKTESALQKKSAGQ